MTKAQHTRGPWEVQGDTYVTVNSLVIAHCKQAGSVTLGEAEANARLIAAAPKLLAAFEDIFRFLDATRWAKLNMTDAEWNRLCFVAREAIAKAKGEA